MEKLVEHDLTYFYLSHVVIVVTAVTTISVPSVNIETQTIESQNQTFLNNWNNYIWFGNSTQLDPLKQFPDLNFYNKLTSDHLETTNKTAFKHII